MRQDFLIIQNKPFKSFNLNGEIRYIDKLDIYLKELSLIYGSSIEGRKDSVKFYTDFKYKLPIIISNKYELYYLCTRDIKAKDCILINYKMLESFKALGSKTRLKFINGFEYDIDADYRIIKRQIKIIDKYLNQVFQRML